VAHIVAMAGRPPTPKEEQRVALLATRVTDAFKAKVEAAAKSEGRSLSDWLLRAAEAALRRQETGMKENSHE